MSLDHRRFSHLMFGPQRDLFPLLRQLIGIQSSSELVLPRQKCFFVSPRIHAVVVKSSHLCAAALLRPQKPGVLTMWSIILIFLPRPLLKVGLSAVFGLLIKVSPSNRVVLRLPLCKIIAVAVDKRPVYLFIYLFFTLLLFTISLPAADDLLTPVRTEEGMCVGWLDLCWVFVSCGVRHELSSYDESNLTACQNPSVKRSEIARTTAAVTF